MNPRVLEILDRRAAIRLAIGELCAEDLVLETELREILETKERKQTRSGDVPLVFDPDGRTIRWDGGSVRLGKKPYKFVQALYLAKKKRMRIAGIAKAVWGNELEPHSTIRVAFCRLKPKLEIANFPYKILSRTDKKKTVEYKDKRTGEHREIVVQPAITGFSIQRYKTG